jgi:hypothetical protein
MPTYYIDLLMANGKIGAAATIFCPDDNEAIAWVSEMMAQPGDYPVAKVWSGARLVAELP